MSIEKNSGSSTINRNEVPVKIAEVTPIEQSRGEMMLRKEQLHEFIEAPLLSACEELYEKNVRTLSASANQKDIVFGTAHLAIDFDSLSEENKLIGEQLGEVRQEETTHALSISLPVTANSTVEEVKKNAEAVAHKFKKQVATWIPSYTLEEMRKIHGIDANDEKYGIEAFTEQCYYDPSKKLFYMSEEHARKAEQDEDTRKE